MDTSNIFLSGTLSAIIDLCAHKHCVSVWYSIKLKSGNLFYASKATMVLSFYVLNICTKYSKMYLRQTLVYKTRMSPYLSNGRR